MTNLSGSVLISLDHDQEIFNSKVRYNIIRSDTY